MPVSNEPVARRYVVAIPCGGGCGAAGERRVEPALLLWEACRRAAAHAPRAVRIELFAEPCAKALAIDVPSFTHALACVLGLAVKALDGHAGRIELHAREMTSAFAEVGVRVLSEDPGERVLEVGERAEGPRSLRQARAYSGSRMSPSWAAIS